VVVLLSIVSSKKLAEIEKREALINETNDCLASGDWKCAEQNVRELLKAEPNDSNLQMHMAGIFFEQERYRECTQYIESLNFRNEELNYLVEKSNLLEKEMESLGVEKSMHFRLEFDGHPSKKDVMEALAVLEVAYDSISNLFGFMPENKIGVVLYEAKNYQGVGERPDWVAAVFDGKLRVPVNMMAYREVYRPVLFHELTHAFVRAMTRAQVPLWMNEGIAQVIGASKREMERPSGGAPSLKSLTEPFVNESNTATAIKLYWYSLRMVENMLSRGGGGVDAFRKFANCLQDLRKLKTDEALQKYFGTTSKELLESVQ
jgi:tetratricopeptide (TPR) repeat protein